MTSGVQPMASEDVTEVAMLFRRAFRDGTPPSVNFIEYLSRSFFSSPSYDKSFASLVHRDETGALDAALLVIPMQVRANGRVLTGRLMSNYMTDPDLRTRGGADMVLTIRARNQEFCFSDSANAVSARHWRAIGGHHLPVQSLDWQVVFRPAQRLAQRAAHRLPRWLRGLATFAAKPIDRVLRRLLPKRNAPALNGAPMPRAAFVASAPTLVQRFALHPVWPAEELTWLLDMAALHTKDGPLQLRELRALDGKLLGCCVYYARPGSMARVLNILTAKGHEDDVMADLVHHLDTMGCVGAVGIAQPFLMPALCQLKGLHLVPRGGYCISTRHPDIVDAVLRGDAYLGGLMGEDWSRLVTDFHD